jgi:pyrrolidone-carboxylate peptidase/uncharacterized protein (DUF2249 family)
MQDSEQNLNIEGDAPDSTPQRPIDDRPPGNGDGDLHPVNITRISPIAGALAGGITVTLMGTGFEPGAEVYFGDSQSTNVTVEGSTTAHAELPPATETGSVSVTLVNPDGSAATKAGGFTYITTGQGEQAEVLGVEPLAVIEDTETEVVISGHNLIEAYNSGTVALRGPRRANITRSNVVTQRDEATGTESLTVTVRITATPPLEPVERMAVQVLASRRPGSLDDGIFESSTGMFAVLARAVPVALAYSADLQPGKPNLVVVAGRNLEGCTLELGQDVTVHLQRSEDRLLSAIVTVPDNMGPSFSPQLSLRSAGGEEVAQYSMSVAPGDGTEEAGIIRTKLAETDEEASGIVALPVEDDISLTLIPVPGQQVFGPTERDSAVFNLSDSLSVETSLASPASFSSFGWSNFAFRILQRQFTWSIVREVHLIPFFDGKSGDDKLSDSPILAEVGKLFRLRGVGLIVALHIKIVITITIILFIGFVFEIWPYGLFNEFPEYGWAIGSLVFSFELEAEAALVLSFLLAAVLPGGALRVILSLNLKIGVDFTLTPDKHILHFGFDHHVNHIRIGPLLNLLRPCNGLFQLAEENGNTVFSDDFGGNHSFYFPRASGECCVPWNFDLQLVRVSSGKPEEILQSSFRADYCLTAAPVSSFVAIIITSEHPAPEGIPPTLVLNVNQEDAALRAFLVQVDSNGLPTGTPPQDVRDLGYDVEFFLDSPLEVVLDPETLRLGDASAIQTGENLVRARLTPRASERPQFNFWPESVLGFANIASLFREGRAPAIEGGGLPVRVKPVGKITITPKLAYRNAQGNLIAAQPISQQLQGERIWEMERDEPFETQRPFVLAVNLDVPLDVPLPQTLTFNIPSLPEMRVLHGNSNTAVAEAPLGIKDNANRLVFENDRAQANDLTRFFTGELLKVNKQVSITINPNSRPAANDLIEVPGLDIVPNNKEVAASGGASRRLVPPGRRVTNTVPADQTAEDRYVLLLANIEARCNNANLTSNTLKLQLAVSNEETFEEYVRVFDSVQNLLSGQSATVKSFHDFPVQFYNELKNNAPNTPAPDLLKTQGNKLWKLAYEAVEAAVQSGQSADADDRLLYYTRLEAIAALRTYCKRNGLSQPNASQFEWPSRGLEQSDGSIKFDTALVGNARKAIVTGFDPFNLTFQPTTSNPSGLVALAFNAKLIAQVQPPVYVRTAVFPVRYKDFNDGLIEKAVRPSLSSIVLLATLSEHGHNFYDVERFAARSRGTTPGIFIDNNLLSPNPINIAQVKAETIWVEDSLPAGATPAGNGESWNWVAANPPPFFGSASHQSNIVAGLHQHSFSNATQTLIVNRADQLFTYIYLDPANMPSEIMLQWNDGTSWEHRAYWGANQINLGTDGTESRRYMGALPGAGQWIALVVSASQVGLEGKTPNGMAFTLYGGRAAWDHAGKISSNEYFESTLPYTDVIKTAQILPGPNVNAPASFVIDQSYKVKGATGERSRGLTPILIPGVIRTEPEQNDPAGYTKVPDQPDLHYDSEEGSGGSYLSNEIFYRTALVRDSLRPRLASGHIHVPPTNINPQAGGLNLIEGARQALASFLQNLYRLTSLGDINFPPTPIRTPSAPQTLMATNETGEVINVASIEVTSPFEIAQAVQFPIQVYPTPPLPLSVPPFTLKLAYRPTTVGPDTGTVKLLDAAGEVLLTANLTGEGTPVFIVAGQIMVNGVPLTGVQVALSGSRAGTMMTGADGRYSFTELYVNSNYIITPSLANYHFTPVSQSLSSLGANQTVNFIAVRNRQRIRGRVVNANGTGIAGASVTLSGAQSASLTTDSTGNYSFDDLPAGDNYVVTVARANYSFAPGSKAFNNLTADMDFDFTGTLATYTISGRVTSGVAPLGGVTVNLSGSQTANATTDANGNYSFTLNAEGNYTITPSKQFYTCAPSNATFNNLSANQTANFTATLNRHTISGRVTRANGIAVAGATMTLSGSQPGTTTTDANGNYSFADLPAGGDYTITPSRAHYTFTPASRAFAALGANQTADFTGVIVRFMLSGTVTLNGAGFADVTVSLNGSDSGTTTTDANGNYSFTVDAEGSYTITPSKLYYACTPSSATFNNLAANQTVNFTAALKHQTISGHLTKAFDGSSMVGVAVTLSGSQSRTTTSDEEGNFSFADLPAIGSYSVMPTLDDYEFTPGTRGFNNLPGDVNALFTAVRTGNVTGFRWSGKVTLNGVGLPGVKMRISQSEEATTTTDANGNYSFTVFYDDICTVTPELSGYAFTPASRQTKFIRGDVVVNFTATQTG